MMIRKAHLLLGIVLQLVCEGVAFHDYYDFFAVDLQCYSFDALEPPRFFDETVDGVSSSTGFKALEENWLTIDADHCLTDEAITGIQYIKVEDGIFSFEVLAFNPGTLVIERVRSVPISGAADRDNYQYKCLDTPIPVEFSVYGVSYADKTSTPSKVALMYNLHDKAAQYPCGPHLNKDSHTVYERYDMDADELDGGISFEDTFKTMLGKMAIRAITDREFRYTCVCSSDARCQIYDCNMKCNMDTMQCACTDGYIYNPIRNRCLLEGAAINKAVMMSSPAGADGAALVDGDFATCVTTDAETSPWIVIDLESEIIVHAVNIKIPIPASRSIKVFSDESTSVEYSAPSPWTVTGTVFKIESAGPWPLKVISRSSAGTFSIINRDLRGGTFNAADFGTVSDIGTVELVEHVGYIKKGDLCLTVNETSGQPSAGTSNCATFYITPSDQAFDIILLTTDDSFKHLKFTGINDGATATFNTGMTFKFYGDNFAAIPDLTSALAGEFTLSFINHGNKCVNIEDGAVTITSDAATHCNTAQLSFVVHDNIRAATSSGGYQYKTINVDGETSLTFDSPHPIIPCVEVVSAGESPLQGAVVLEPMDTNQVQLDGYELDPDYAAGMEKQMVKATTGPIPVKVRSTVSGISEFSVYVSDTFDGSTFGPLSASLCTSVRGYPKHGDVNNVFTCDSPVTGRYVALAPTQPYSVPGNALTICEVQVHALYTPGEGVCDTDADCRDCRQSGVVDENYYCNLDTHTCECRSGYMYWSPAQQCVNRNECLDNPNPCGDVDETQDGIEDAICKDLFGSYTCECPDGYVADTVNGGCKDVNECLERGVLRHSCDELCINTFGGYNCSCNEGSYLDAADLTSCLDIDECNETSRDVYGVSEYSCGMYMPEDDGNYAPPNCTNTQGSYTCYCIDGYEYLGTATSGSDPFRCEDIKECSVNNGGCAATCIETNIIDDGIKYNCSCPTGLVLASNSLICQDIDECSEEGGTILHDCGDESNNTAMSDNAETKALCRNTYGSYECYCPTGWSFNADEQRCEDINECESLSPCMHLCDNTNGSYECTCMEGFNLLDDKKTCQDRNECDGDDHGCQQVCINVFGSYGCGCLTGYTLNADGKTCEASSEEGSSLQITFCLNVDYLDVYDDMTASESRDLAEQLEDNMRNRLADPDYNVMLFYRCPTPLQSSHDRLGVNVTVLPPGDVTQVELASYASELSSALSASPLTIDGQAVPLVGSPQFIKVGQPGADPFVVETPCDYLASTNYCQNRARCQLVNGQPECICRASFQGSQCTERVEEGGLSTREVVLIAACTAALVVLVFLCACVYVLCRQKRPAEWQEYPTPPSSYFPNELSPSYRWNYNYYHM